MRLGAVLVLYLGSESAVLATFASELCLVVSRRCNTAVAKFVSLSIDTLGILFPAEHVAASLFRPAPASIDEDAGRGTVPVVAGKMEPFHTSEDQLSFLQDCYWIECHHQFLAVPVGRVRTNGFSKILSLVGIVVANGARFPRTDGIEG